MDVMSVASGRKMLSNGEGRVDVRAVYDLGRPPDVIPPRVDEALVGAHQPRACSDSVTARDLASMAEPLRDSVKTLRSVSISSSLLAAQAYFLPY